MIQSEFHDFFFCAYQRNVEDYFVVSCGVIEDNSGYVQNHQAIAFEVVGIAEELFGYIIFDWFHIVTYI